MLKNSQNISIKSKVWLEDNRGRVIFGLGRMKILRAIRKHGSLNAAARELKMSYRAVWGKIKTTEEALGKPLLVKSQGGASGGGSTLTPYAIRLMERYKTLHTTVECHADKVFHESLLEE